MLAAHGGVFPFIPGKPCNRFLGPIRFVIYQGVYDSNALLNAVVMSDKYEKGDPDGYQVAELEICTAKCAIPYIQIYPIGGGWIVEKLQLILQKAQRSLGKTHISLRV